MQEEKKSGYPLQELILSESLLPLWLQDNTGKRIKQAKLHEGTTHGRKHQEVSTIISVNGGKPFKPLDIVDFAIVSALDSEFYSGNRVISFRRLYQDLGGGECLHEKMQENLFKRVNRLKSLAVEIDASEVTKNFYPNFTGKKIINSNFICAEVEKTEFVGGVSADAIHILDTSPVFRYSAMKKQVARINPEVVSADLRFSENTLKIMWCLLDSVVRIVRSNSNKRGKRAKPMTPTIILDRIFEKCGFTNLDKDRKKQVRLHGYVKKILEHFKNCGLVKSYEIDKKINGFYVNFAL